MAEAEEHPKAHEIELAMWTWKDVWWNVFIWPVRYSHDYLCRQLSLKVSLKDLLMFWIGHVLMLTGTIDLGRDP